MRRARTHARTRGGARRHRYVTSTSARGLAVPHVGKCVKDVRTGLQNDDSRFVDETSSSLSLFLSLFLSSLPSSLSRSFAPTLSFPRQSEQRFLRNLYCKSTDAANQTWEIGHVPRTKLFSETLAETNLTIPRRDKIDFIHSNYI